MMQHLTKKSMFILRIVSLVFAFSYFMLPLNAHSKMELVPVEGAAYNVHASFTENLRTFVGKKVYITLDCGKVMAGYIKEVGEHLVHLEKLEGKDYFDALIPLGRISAFDTRFREPKRQ